MPDAASTFLIVVAAVAVLALLVWFLKARTPETTNIDDNDEPYRKASFEGRPAGPAAERQIAPEYGAPDGENGLLEPRQGSPRRP